MTPVVRNRLIGLALALAIFAVDQWVKWHILWTFKLRERGVVDLLPFFDLRWTQNFGVSMGMFEATSVEARWILVGVTALIAVMVTIWLLRERKLGDILGLSLILGGALGNIKDRYELGYVIDYADLHFGEFRPFLIFNIADAAITIGVVIILVRAFFLRDTDDEAADGTSADAAESTS
ncbi:signal peptidase II [Qipengyuania sp.]|uniref:signal peptidase II n=1 Tax=Qipengyuania sp. TaxID=2004515 RepID=UPI003736BC8C